jgi:uncharacterized protein (DUF362 family)/ferredoxin
MDQIVAVRKCSEYNVARIIEHLEFLYSEAKGPDPSGKRILVKPNILSDDDPERATITHPAVVEAVIKFLQSKGATVLVGDSPTFDTRSFTGEKSGIKQVADSCGAKWVRFNNSSFDIKVGSSNVKVTSVIKEVDLIISLPKLKNHELMILTGAIKNIFGLVPEFNKALQHVKFPDRFRLAKFLIDLEDALKPDFHIMDGIVAMEGPGPGNGYPVNVNVLLASKNPLALDIIASRITGYDPLRIPTNKVGLERGHLLKSLDEINLKGADLNSLIIKNFKRIGSGGAGSIVFRAVKKKIPLLRTLERRPIFNHNKCIRCLDCLKICPLDAISHDKDKKIMYLNDKICIRCFCCSEVCREGAIEIRRKLF